MRSIQIYNAEEMGVILRVPRGKMHPLAAVALQLTPGEYFKISILLNKPFTKQNCHPWRWQFFLTIELRSNFLYALR